ncbi:MAG: carbonic anhydrase [Bdellovibrionaceae bacterium]|nr:carbonic anhydrase [Pseudobdellovibrionaceae bacterium]
MKPLNLPLFFFVFFLLACAHKEPLQKQTQDVGPQQQDSGGTQPQNPSDNPVSVAENNKEFEVALAKKTSDSTSSPPHLQNPQQGTTTRQIGPVPADQAWGWLKNGNIRFVRGRLRADGQSSKDVQRLASGQKPHSAILSCSDSRVPPEIIFDQKLGEIFVVRLAGPGLDPSVIASLEHAVWHLGVNQIVVLGHTHCGAVKAALDSLKGIPTDSPHLAHLLKDLEPRLNVFKDKAPSLHYRAETMANVHGVMKELLSKSTLIQSATADGSLKIRTAVYDLTNGQVSWE